VLAARPDLHDAVLAFHHGQGGSRSAPVGLGSLAVPDPDGPAELGLLVADPWQRQGAGGALLDTLLRRARARGVARVSAFVLPERRTLLDVLARRLAHDSTTRTVDGLTGVYRLT